MHREGIKEFSQKDFKYLELWKRSIGEQRTLSFSCKRSWNWQPGFQYYLNQFQRFQGKPGTHKFSLSWNWAVFLLGEVYLWCLYRKLFLPAFITFVLPFVVWGLIDGPFEQVILIGLRILFALCANYVYFLHVKRHVSSVVHRTAEAHTARFPIAEEEGGTQPFIFWVGLVYLLYGYFPLFYSGILDFTNPSF